MKYSGAWEYSEHSFLPQLTSHPSPMPSWQPVSTPPWPFIVRTMKVALLMERRELSRNTDLQPWQATSSKWPLRAQKRKDLRKQVKPAAPSPLLMEGQLPLQQKGSSVTLTQGPTLPVSPRSPWKPELPWNKRKICLNTTHSWFYSLGLSCPMPKLLAVCDDSTYLKLNEMNGQPGYIQTFKATL